MIVGVSPYVLLLSIEYRYLGLFGRQCSEAVTAVGGKPRSFIQCEKKPE